MRATLPAFFLATSAAALTAQAAPSPLPATLARIAADAHGHVGVACSLPGTPLACNLNATAGYPMQSVYKLPIALAALHAVEQGRLSLSQPIPFLPGDALPRDTYSPLRDEHPHGGVSIPVQHLLELAVSQSDGTASDILLCALGGAHAVRAYLESIGLPGIHIADTEQTLNHNPRAQYRNDAQPAAMIALLRRIADHSPLTPQHTALLLGWMTASSTGPGRLKGLLPPGTPVAHKTGTSGTHHGMTPATNDVGLITLPGGRTLAIAVFVSDSTANDDTRDAVIARIARRSTPLPPGNLPQCSPVSPAAAEPPRTPSPQFNPGRGEASAGGSPSRSTRSLGRGGSSPAAQCE